MNYFGIEFKSRLNTIYGSKICYNLGNATNFHLLPSNILYKVT